MKTSLQHLAERMARHTDAVRNNRQRTHTSRRRGSITVIAALGIVVILGTGALAVDYSILLADRNRLQRACDAAALAGASQLKLTGLDSTDTNNARNMALTVAGQNNVLLNAANITFLDNNKQIRVPANTTRSLFFARMLGINSKDVTASATARVSPGGDTTTEYVAPIGITWETYNAYKNSQDLHGLSLVRQNKAVFELDDFVLFDLRGPNGKSTAHMQDQLTGDEIVPVTIGTFQTTLNAADNAQRSKLERGLETLFDRADGAPWHDDGSSENSVSSAYTGIYNGTLDRSNPRVVHIIVTPRTTIPNNGTYDTEIQGFVPVYLESVDFGPKHSEDSATLYVRFLPPTSASDGGFEPNPNGHFGGVRVIGLVG